MIKEKKNGNIFWFRDNELKIKLKKIDNGKCLFWVLNNDRNIAFTMLMYDFTNWYYDLDGVDIKVDRSWNNHCGFKTEENNFYILVHEIKRFINEYHLESSEKNDVFSKNEWYNVV